MSDCIQNMINKLSLKNDELENKILKNEKRIRVLVAKREYLRIKNEVDTEDDI